MKSLLVLYSYPHNNTEKIANVFAKVRCKNWDVPVDEPRGASGVYLVGFGSGIDSGKHYQVLLDFADKLPQVKEKKAFIFSTAGITGKKVAGDHSVLRKNCELRAT